MGGVRDFFEKLSGVQKDVLMSVATDLQASSPPEKVKRLTEFHEQLKKEIDQINGRREALGGILSNLEAVLRFLASYIRENGETMELVLFRTSIQKFATDLRVEVALLKPEKKLAKKFDVARRVESLMQRQTLSGYLFKEVIGGDAKPVKSVNIDNYPETFSEDVEDPE
jgi:hypothetical protein